MFSFSKESFTTIIQIHILKIVLNLSITNQGSLRVMYHKVQNSINDDHTEKNDKCFFVLSECLSRYFYVKFWQIILQYVIHCYMNGTSE